MMRDIVVDEAISEILRSLLLAGSDLPERQLAAILGKAMQKIIYQYNYNSEFCMETLKNLVLNINNQRVAIISMMVVVMVNDECAGNQTEILHHEDLLKSINSLIHQNMDDTMRVILEMVASSLGDKKSEMWLRERMCYTTNGLDLEVYKKDNWVSVLNRIAGGWGSNQIF
jgi:hypothetical protein